MHYINLTWICPFCNQETELEVEPYVPAKISGPPESCSPEEGGLFSPNECEHCGALIDEEKVWKLVDEITKREPDYE